MPMPKVTQLLSLFILILTCVIPMARASADERELCRTSLPSADQALSKARRHSDAAMIKSAGAYLEQALSDAHGCGPDGSLYLAHLEESRCNAPAARAYYARWLEQARANGRAAAVVDRVRGLERWQSTQISVSPAHEPSGTTPHVEVSCRWEDQADPEPSCVAEAASQMTLTRPSTAGCDYVASAAGHHTVRGKVAGTVPMTITLEAYEVSRPAGPDVIPPPEPRPAATDDAISTAQWIALSASGLATIGGAIAIVVAMNDKSKVENAPDAVALSDIQPAHDRVPVLSTLGFLTLGLGIAGAGTTVGWIVMGNQELQHAAISIGINSVRISGKF